MFNSARSRVQWVGSAAILCLAVAVAGCTTAASKAKLASSASAERAEGSQAPADMMARCKRLYGMWARYQPPDFMTQSSRGALAQGGLADCQSGHYDTGIAELEQLLKDDRIPFAAGPATPATASR
jgi:hypothetical protein